MPTGRLTLDDLEIVEIESDPLTVGMSAPVGSLGISADYGVFRKTGESNTAWRRLQDQSFPVLFSSLEESNTTSQSSYLNKLSVSVPSVISGPCLISASFKCRVSSNDRNIDIQILHNGAQIAQCLYLLSNANSNRPLHSFFVPRTLNAGDTVQFQFKVGDRGTTTAYVSQVVMKIEKVN